MNTYRLSVIFTLIACLCLKAQTSEITITVISESEENPIPGATVYFEALNQGTITDFEGIATFNEIPHGTHAVSISYLGFETL
ncbi:MAG: carboxypeptidase-like regulatory domain-containing protein, partial [Bacteroidota bacterium]